MALLRASTALGRLCRTWFANELQLFGFYACPMLRGRVSRNIHAIACLLSAWDVPSGCNARWESFGGSDEIV